MKTRSIWRKYLVTKLMFNIVEWAKEACYAVPYVFFRIYRILVVIVNCWIKIINIDQIPLVCTLQSKSLQNEWGLMQPVAYLFSLDYVGRGFEPRLRRVCEHYDKNHILQKFKYSYIYIRGMLPVETLKSKPLLPIEWRYPLGHCNVVDN